MEKFDDGFGDLSGFKILSFEEVSKGFKGDIHPFRQALEIQDAETTGIKNDEYINLTGLLGDIKVSYSGGRGEYMQYVPEKYFNDTAQNYIMDGRKHISLSAKLHLKKGTVKVSQRMGVYKPLMEVFLMKTAGLPIPLPSGMKTPGGMP